MTNGAMEESLSGKAYIKDLEPETFAGFAKFAYLGICGVSSEISGSSKQTDGKQPEFDWYRCRNCGSAVQVSTGEHYPFCSENCSVNRNRWGQKGQNGYCIVYGCRTGYTNISEEDLLCASHIGTEEGQKYVAFKAGHLAKSNNVAKFDPGTEFCNRKYGCKNLTHNELGDHLQFHQSKGKSSSKSAEAPLLRHAKLYVLAHTYMVNDLQDICLHQLHRSLVELDLNDASIEEVIDLVSYTYDNTSEGGDILLGTADRMRQLVISFVKDRSKLLMKSEGMRYLLAGGGPQTADFFALTWGKDS